MSKKGLSLLEALIVLTILGLIFAITIFAITIPLILKMDKDSIVDPVGYYNVTYLFETNGIKVYRFHDCGGFQYFYDTRSRTADNYIQTIVEEWCAKRNTNMVYNVEK